MTYRAGMADQLRENVIIRGAIALLSDRGSLTPEECAALTELLREFDRPGFATPIGDAIAFLQPTSEQHFGEVVGHLVEHLQDESRGLMTVEERFAQESAERDAMNDFARELGEDVDPDAPWEFPTAK